MEKAKENEVQEDLGDFLEALAEEDYSEIEDEPKVADEPEESDEFEEPEEEEDDKEIEADDDSDDDEDADEEDLEDYYNQTNEEDLEEESPEDLLPEEPEEITEPEEEPGYVMTIVEGRPLVKFINWEKFTIGKLERYQREVIREYQRQRAKAVRAMRIAKNKGE